MEEVEVEGAETSMLELGEQPLWLVMVQEDREGE